ncbi:hypothetical protein LCGC14_1381280 [marine sediment metagenome]|uniref:Uncharacterized protein n=1 Tax=marine sediment metagenome TaxID=412755 RepID=A0A0F9N4A4_9ZZZZ
MEWTDLDKEATREGFAILRAFRSLRARRPQGIDRQDVKANSMKKDILKELGIIGGKSA